MEGNHAVAVLAAAADGNAKLSKSVGFTPIGSK
jgi:hypothetical protein